MRAGATAFALPARGRDRYTPAMSQNPAQTRPDRAPRGRMTEAPRAGQPTIGMVSLGCPKALVDSERILTSAPRAMASRPTIPARTQ